MKIVSLVTINISPEDVMEALKDFLTKNSATTGFVEGQELQNSLRQADGSYILTYTQGGVLASATPQKRRRMEPKEAMQQLNLKDTTEKAPSEPQEPSEEAKPSEEPSKDSESQEGKEEASTDDDEVDGNEPAPEPVSKEPVNHADAMRAAKTLADLLAAYEASPKDKSSKAVYDVCKESLTPPPPEPPAKKTKLFGKQVRPKN